ncbi:MAG TPA: MlaD family protein [Acidimicrobiales bacterium]|nr:MlaD family protein [Acidimicrobiales bacterium]
MKSFADRNPYVIGIVSVLVIAAATGMAFMVGILHLLEPTYSVQAVFKDAAGVRVGDEVRVAGVKAGRVDKVRANREAGNVIVDLVVNDGVQLGPETSAEVALETLLGTKFVRLSGPVVEPYLESLPDERRRIPLERTKTPFDVFELTSIGTRVAQETDTAKLNQFITQLADITEGKHDQIKDLVEGIATVSEAVTSRETQLRSLLDRTEALSGTLADKDQTLVSLIDQSRGILTLLEQRKRDIAAGLESGSGAFDELSLLITHSRASIDAILDTLHPTLDILAKHYDDIDRTLAWVGPGAYHLSKATSHGPWADIYIRSIGPDLVCAFRLTAGQPC